MPVADCTVAAMFNSGDGLNQHHGDPYNGFHCNGEHATVRGYVRGFSQRQCTRTVTWSSSNPTEPPASKGEY